MIKNLVSFGCSWPHGMELTDPLLKEQGVHPLDPANEQYRLLHSYPGIIAGHYGWTLTDRTVVNSTLPEMTNNFVDWLNHTPVEEIAESFVLVGLTHETSVPGATEDAVFINAVSYIDKIATREKMKLLQFNVTARQHKLKYPTLIESSSALEMLVIRDKPRKAPLFAEYKHPNEKGHLILSEFLIDKIDSVILNEC